MFFKPAFTLLSVFAFSSGVFAKPILSVRSGSVVANVASRDTSGSNSPRSSSLNNYGGQWSMSNFDGFYGGSENFDGSRNTQIVIQDTQTVCHTEQVEIIQQKLVILQEIAKRIITEQICEVETQTIVIQQFQSSMESFMKDMRRKSGKRVGYDANIASKYNHIVNSDGSLNAADLGFSGSDVGDSTIVPAGSNWDDMTSPGSVAAAYAAALSAANST